MSLVEKIKNLKGPLSVNQVADELGCHALTIYRWVEDGKIPFMRIGRRIKFDPPALAFGSINEP